jgi:hypothetical protein
LEASVMHSSAMVDTVCSCRSAADNSAYRDLLNSWIVNGCKLRYSGGMVPDVHHILAKVSAHGSSPTAFASISGVECTPAPAHAAGCQQVQVGAVPVVLRHSCYSHSTTWLCVLLSYIKCCRCVIIIGAVGLH